MTRILDSSAIFKAIKVNAIDRTAECHTLELARYELGNIVWKQHNLHKTLNREESLKLIEVITGVLASLQVHHVNGMETEILKLAADANTTFHDASYLHQARELSLPLASEDKRLIEIALQLGIEASTLMESF